MTYPDPTTMGTELLQTPSSTPQLVLINMKDPAPLTFSRDSAPGSYFKTDLQLPWMPGCLTAW